MKIKSILPLFLFLISICYSDSTGVIKGKIIDIDNQLPLSGANIVIKSTSIGGVSDDKGYFSIKDIPYGNYTIIVIAEPKNELLFTANDSFEIQEIIVANSENEINVSMISDFSESGSSRGSPAPPPDITIRRSGS